MDKLTGRQTDRQMNGWSDVQIDEWTGWMSGEIDQGQGVIQKDGWKGEHQQLEGETDQQR